MFHLIFLVSPAPQSFCRNTNSYDKSIKKTKLNQKSRFVHQFTPKGYNIKNNYVIEVVIFIYSAYNKSVIISTKILIKM